MEDFGWLFIYTVFMFILMQWTTYSCCKRQERRIKVKETRRSTTTSSKSRTRSNDPQIRSAESNIPESKPKQISAPIPSSEPKSSTIPTDNNKPKEPSSTPTSAYGSEMMDSKQDSFVLHQPKNIRAKRAPSIRKRGFVSPERDDYKTMKAGLPSSDFEDSV